MQTAQQTEHAISEHKPQADLTYIAPADLVAVWPSIEHLVPSIIERSRGRLTLEAFIEAIASGHQHLWVVDDGDGTVLAIVGVETSVAASGMKLCRIAYAAGDHSNRWIHLISQIEDLARDHGCQKLELFARKGWERKLPDYKLTHVFLEKDLA